MRHSEVQACMADYLEGDLPLQKRALFDAHLDACEQCSRDLRELRGTVALLRSLPDPEPPPTLVAGVMRRVRAGEARWTVGDRIRDWLSSLAEPAFAVPAAIVVLALALLSVRIDIYPLGFGAPGNPSVAAQRPLEVVMRPGRVPEAVPRETQVASAQPGGGVSVPNSTGLGLSARSQAVVESAAPSNADHAGARRVVRLRIPLNTAPGGSPQMAGRPGSNAVPPGVLVGASSVPEQPFSEASASGGLVVAEGRTSEWGSRGTSTVDPAVAGSSFEREAWERAENRRRELDLRLEFLLRNPTAFSSEFAGLSAGEQQLWLRAIVGHAIEREVADRAVAVLRGTGDAGAFAVAEDFSAELQSLRGAGDVTTGPVSSNPSSR